MIMEGHRRFGRKITRRCKAKKGMRFVPTEGRRKEEGDVREVDGPLCR